MPVEKRTSFISYSHQDSSEFVLNLAKDLRNAGADIWLDQLNIDLGDPWDDTVQRALSECPRVIVVFSPASVASKNVLDEISFALKKGKVLVPVYYLECEIPYRIDRLHRIDFTHGYAAGLKHLLRHLLAADVVNSKVPSSLMDDEVSTETDPNVTVDQAKYDRMQIL